MDNMGVKGCSLARSLSPDRAKAAYRFVETAVTVRPAHAPNDNPVVAESFGSRECMRRAGGAERNN